MAERSLSEMYGYAYLREFEAAEGERVLLTYGHADGALHTEDVADYFADTGTWWATDVEAIGMAAGRVLDIGCGAGRHALALQDAGHEVVGIEPSADAVAVARRRGIDAHVGTLMDLPAGLGRFDTLLLAGGGLHILFQPEHRGAALTRLAAHAAAGARLVGTCPVVPDDDEPGAVRAYRLRVEAGGERTGWSGWGSTVLLPADRLAPLTEGTPWTVEEVRAAPPSDVPSYVARLGLRAAGGGR